MDGLTWKRERCVLWLVHVVSVSHVVGDVEVDHVRRAPPGEGARRIEYLSCRVMYVCCVMYVVQ